MPNYHRCGDLVDARVQCGHHLHSVVLDLCSITYLNVHLLNSISIIVVENDFELVAAIISDWVSASDILVGASVFLFRECKNQSCVFNSWLGGDYT